MPRSRTWYFLILLIIGYAVLVFPTLACALEPGDSDNTVCLACHDIFDAPAVDRNAVCVACHAPGLVGTHPYHQAGSNCAAYCHPGWGNSLLTAVPSYTDPASSASFASAMSKAVPASVLHIIHSNPRWPENVDTPDSRCASCHAAASCDACHTGAIGADHGSHSSTSQQPHSGRFGHGIVGTDQSIWSVQAEETMCATAGCHDIETTRSNAARTREDFSHPASPANGYDEPNTVTLTPSAANWRTRYNAQHTAGRMSLSNYAGAGLSIAFEGERIMLVADKDPYRGIAQILIDGALAGTVDFYAPTTTYQATVFDSGPLAAGSHTITVRATGTKNPSSRHTFISVDCFKVYATLPGSIAPQCADTCHANAAGHDTAPHLLHLSATDPRGFGGATCSDCHAVGTGDYSQFASGADISGDGKIDLAETDVCNECHSPDGGYDGVDSTPSYSGVMSVGAKDNWAGGVYETAQTLQAGKGRWCIGCHDGAPGVPGYMASLINGAYAPAVGGDEGGAYTYGTGYGYYSTGHGVPASQVIPANGFDAGPGLECDDCHDNVVRHIDGQHRTYSAAANNYRVGYRLDLVDGQQPMSIPSAASKVAGDFRLCFKCHTSGPYLDIANANTNFRNNSMRLHPFHAVELARYAGNSWDSDWSGGGYDSDTSCPTCHNVHGSQRLAMIRDGNLIYDTVDRRPGLDIWYYTNGVSAWNTSDPNPPTPGDVPMTMSDGWIWRGATAANLCQSCHSGSNTSNLARTTWQSFDVVPKLDWVNESGYLTDGANPDAASANENWTFRVSYSDGNNDAPVFVDLLLDRNDDGDFADAGERIAMEAEVLGDSVYFDGNVYWASVTPAKAGDNALSYKFECSDGITGLSTTPTRTVQVNNAIPVIRYTGDAGYEDDYVSPNSGTTNETDYEFRITYSDADGELPDGGLLLQLNINDANGFNDPGEQIIMTDMGDPDVTAGKRYTATSKLIREGNGSHMAFFNASDGIDAAPPRGGYAWVQPAGNTAPSLNWTGEPEYVSDGVTPDVQAETKPFSFRVKYTDLNNDAPGVAQIWIDLNDNAVYEPGEKFPMNDPVTGSSPAGVDGDYSNGETFAETVHIPHAGDGTLNYRFYFEDNKAAPATGAPSSDKALSVFQTLQVPSEYPTIQAAVDSASTSDTVLVADGTYASFSFNGKDIYVESVNGPDSTFIQQFNSTCIRFNNTGSNPSNSIVTGFTLRNAFYGVNATESRATIRDCVFDGMKRGVSNMSNGSWPVVIADCVFQNGTEYAVYTSDNTSVTRITDTKFLNNSSTLSGTCTGRGACYYGLGGNLQFDRCDFEGNSASSGGVVANWSGGSFDLRFNDCAFSGNTATWQGGVVSLTGSSFQARFDRCLFTGNRANDDGGVAYIESGALYFQNSTLSGNYAADDGGAVLNRFGTVTLTNTTVAGNSGDMGGGVHHRTAGLNGLTKLHNCIVWGNESRSSTKNEIDADNPGRVEIQYTNIGQSFLGYLNQTGNMGMGPMFIWPISASSAPTSNGDYHLKTISPLEGKALAGLAPADDIDRGARPQGTGDDMGSDEIGAAGP